MESHMPQELHRLQPLPPLHAIQAIQAQADTQAARAAAASLLEQDVDCVAIFATNEQWRTVRAMTADVAARAAWLGYASDRFEAWQVSAQRRALGAWPPGDAQLLLTLQQGHSTVRQWLAQMPASAFAPSNVDEESS